MLLSFLPRPPANLFSSRFIPRTATHGTNTAWPRFQRFSGPSRQSLIRIMSSSAGNTEYVSAFTTAPSEQDAEKLALAIVESKVAACVNTIPKVKSYYWWEGAVQNDSEILLLIKTRATLVPQLNDLIKKEHPYDVPELIVHPIVGGSSDYLSWIQGSTVDPKS